MEPFYAYPEYLVSTEWVANHLNDPQVRLVEADEDALLYSIGHLPGAVSVDWLPHYKILYGEISSARMHSRSCVLNLASPTTLLSYSMEIRITGLPATRSGYSNYMDIR